MASLQEVWRWIDANRRKKWGMINGRDIIRLAQGHWELHRWKCICGEETFSWRLPSNGKACVQLGRGGWTRFLRMCAWVSWGSLERLTIRLLSYLPSTSHELRPPAVYLSLALCVAGHCEKPPEFPQWALGPSPPSTNPLVKGRDLLVCARPSLRPPLAPLWGEMISEEWAPTSLIAWAWAGRWCCGRDRGRVGSGGKCRTPKLWRSPLAGWTICKKKKKKFEITLSQPVAPSLLPLLQGLADVFGRPWPRVSDAPECQVNRPRVSAWY